jgi:competence protein ComEC
VPAIALAASGFVAGVFAGLSFAPAVWPLWAGLAVAAAAAWGRRRGPSIVCLAAAAGGIWGSAAAARAARGCAAAWREGERVAVLAEPWDLPVQERRSLVRIREPASCRTIVTVQWPRGAALPPGSVVLVGAWYRGPARGAAWWPSRPGAGAHLVARHARSLRTPVTLRARIRLATERRLMALFGAERFALASALTLGSSSQLERETRTVFARAGLAHILAISGLHVAILAAALVAVLRLAGLPPARARLVALPAVGGYLWLLGLPPPAFRAVCLLVVWESARWRQRPPLRSGVLAVTALGVAAVDPFAVAEVGPWLSFAGAWGAAEGARWWAALPWPGRWRESRVFGLGESVSISLGATLATAPVSALAFGSVATAAVVTNLLAIPVVGVAVPALALALALSTVGTLAASVAAAAAGLALDLLELVAARGQAMPLATIAVTERLAAALLVAGALWVWRRIALPRRRAPYPRIARWRAATAAAALGCAAAWWPLVPSGRSGYREGLLEIDFLPVGQGDAAALRTPGGRWILVDGGPRVAGRDAGAAVVVPFLRRRGVRRLAVVAASHGEADHAGGLPAVLRVFPADVVLEPGEALASPLYREWLTSVARAGSRWRAARAGDSVALDGVVVRVLHPDSAWMALAMPVNENALVLRVEYGAFRVILPGDAGLPMEATRAAGVGTAALLKVSHHGSRSATGGAWLSALAPRVCVVSVGENRFGQPTPEVLGALAAVGCRVYRTDIDGAIAVGSDGRRMWVRTQAGEVEVPLEEPQGETW